MKQLSFTTARAEFFRRATFFVFFLLPALSAFSATDYKFYFAGVRMNSSNSTNIAHNDAFTSGTASYDDNTRTLTLTNVTVSRTGSNHNVVDNVGLYGLKVKLVGNCTLTSRDDYAFVTRYSNSNEMGQTDFLVLGTVTIRSTNKSAIYYEGAADHLGSTFSGPGTLIVESTNSYAMEGTKNNSNACDIMFTDGITASFKGKKGALYKFSDITIEKSSELTFKATNNSNYPIINSAHVIAYSPSDYNHMGGYDGVANSILQRRYATIIQPWGAMAGLNSVGDANTDTYNEDIVITNRYMLLVISAFFPDETFRSYIQSLYQKMYITESEVNARTVMDARSKGLTSLRGVGYFPQLKTLYCQNNSLTELDLSKNTALTTLDCSNNSLTSISGLTNATNIATVNCSGNQLTTFVLNNKTKLTSLDVHDNPKMTQLSCYGCALKSLQVSGCTKLNSIDCSNNSFTSLTITGMSYLSYLDCRNNHSMTKLNCYNNSLTQLNAAYCENLTTIDCQSNYLSSLNLTNCNALTSLNCYNNWFTTLTISDRPVLSTLYCGNNSKLTTLTCNNNALTWLTVDGCSKLETLNCKNNKFTNLTVTDLPLLDKLDCSYNSLLQTLNCSNNALTTLTLNNCNALKQLNCSNNAIGSLEVEGFSNLNTIDCSNNALTSLNLGGCSKLEVLTCRSNQFNALYARNLPKLESLDCSNNPTMNYLYCNNNVLNTLVVENCTGLLELNCSNNDLLRLEADGLSALKVLNCSNNPRLFYLNCDNDDLGNNGLQFSGCGALENLLCRNNQLGMIDVSDCPELSTLRCDNNKISSIDLTENAELYTLSCANNQITDLDLSSNFKLGEVDCSGNDITTLDLSNYDNLRRLDCYDNGLTSLDIHGCNRLVYLDCSRNNLTSLSVPQSSYLKDVFCYGNKIRGANMKAFLANLFDRREMESVGVLHIYNPSLGDQERNVCTTDDALYAWEKNWAAMWYDGFGWTIYQGASIPTPVRGIASDDDSAPGYNLGGQRVGDDYKGIVIQNGRKVRK